MALKLNPRSPDPDAPLSERSLVFLVACVQFVSVLDFLMVAPLGPDLALALGIPTTLLGVVVGSYTVAAGLSGLVGALFLDRFGRRSALAVTMLGLVIATASAAFASGLATLVAARVLAGVFGGLASALAMAILADAVPPQRRGKAMGVVYGAFTVVSVLGVPAGLLLARLGDWRTPFFAVAALGIVVLAAMLMLMPPFRAHLNSAGQHTAARPWRAFLADRRVLLSLSATAVVYMGFLAVATNLPGYVQFNLGYPRDQLDMLFFVAGVVTFVGMRLGGAAVDRGGPVLVSGVGTALMLGVLCVGFLPAQPFVPVMAAFVGFMLAHGIRAVALIAITSNVPAPPERARFMAAQTAVQHLGASAGSMVSSVLLVQRPDQSVGGMPSVVLLSIALAVGLPFLMAALTRRPDPALHGASSGLR